MIYVFFAEILCVNILEYLNYSHFQLCLITPIPAFIAGMDYFVHFFCFFFIIWSSSLSCLLHFNLLLKTCIWKILEYLDIMISFFNTIFLFLFFQYCVENRKDVLGPRDCRSYFTSCLHLGLPHFHFPTSKPGILRKGLSLGWSMKPEL